jgi:hypothetical protein
MDKELEAFLTKNGYTNLKIISGLICGLHDYVTTRAIVVGLNADSYERRYCYQNRDEANAAFSDFKNTDVHPRGNWIKLKGVYKGKAVDLLNPEWCATPATNAVMDVLNV